MKVANMLIAFACSAVLGVAGVAQAPAPLTLQQLEQMALAHNPTLQQANDQVSAAAGRTRQAGLWPNPTVGYKGEQIRGGAYRGGEQGFFVQQNIVLGHKLRAAQRAAAAGGEQQQAVAGEQREAVITAVSLAFYSTLAAQNTEELDEQLTQIASDAARTTLQLENAGQADKPDVLQAQVESEQVQVNLTRAQQQLRQNWTQLAATVGQPGMAKTKLVGDLTTLPAAIEPVPYMNRLLTQSPSVKVAEAGVQRAQAELTNARKQPIPDLQLRGGLEANREINDLSGRPTGWQGFAEVGIQLPIFNRNQGNVQSGVAELDRARKELERVRLELRDRAASQLAEYQSAADAVAKYRTQMLPRAKQAYEMYLTNYRNMAAAYPQVLVSQRTWFQLQTDYIAALEQLWRSATTLQGFLLTQGLTAPDNASIGASTGGMQ